MAEKKQMGECEIGIRFVDSGLDFLFSLDFSEDWKVSEAAEKRMPVQSIAPKRAHRHCSLHPAPLQLLQKGC